MEGRFNQCQVCYQLSRMGHRRDRRDVLRTHEIWTRKNPRTNPRPMPDCRCYSSSGYTPNAWAAVGTVFVVESEEPVQLPRNTFTYAEFSHRMRVAEGQISS